VEIAAVDEGDVDIRRAERAGGIQAAEAAAEDEDAMSHILKMQGATA